jgi:hypothetical protein
MPAMLYLSLLPLGEGVRRTDEGCRGHGPLTIIRLRSATQKTLPHIFRWRVWLDKPW